jgi:uncharacterized protein YbjT (DUF2867 family)
MDKKSEKILVTGATGKQGGAVARYLIRNGFKVKALTRRPESPSAGSLKTLGIELVRGDYDDPESLERALEGIWGVFAVQNTWEAGVEREEEQGKRFAELARKKDVQHYVYTSVGSANRNTGIPHFENKWRVEGTVRSLKFPSYAILRPVFFMENFLASPVLDGILNGQLRMGLKPDTKLQMVAVDDIGKFGLMLFEQYDEMNGLELDIAGDELTMRQTAAILTSATGRKIDFVEVPKENIRKMSEDYASMLEWFDRVGYNVNRADLLSKYGIPLTPLEKWARGIDWVVKKAA